MARLRGVGLAFLVGLVGLVAAGVSGCGGESDETGVPGAPCGAATCAEDQYCCHPDCGLCVAAGVVCPADCS